MYNLTNITAANGIGELMVEVNVLSDGFLGAGFLVVCWLVILGMMIKSDNEARVAVTVSSGITSLLALFLAIVEWIPWTYPIYPVMLFFLGLIMLKVGQR